MEKTLTFTVEDALLSPISFSMLSGAGVVKGADGTTDEVHVHMTTATTVSTNTSTSGLEVDLTDALGTNDKICATAPIFIMETEGDGSLTGTTYTPGEVSTSGKIITVTDAGVTAGQTVMVDYYVLKNAAKVTELQIDAQNFGGYFYVEADTLFRAQIDGKDYPANITLPNVKIQSNWTFTMAATGDPSTFSFTMDAMPGFTYFDKTKKVLCVIQVIEDANDTDVDLKSVMSHVDNEETDIESDEGAVPVDNVPNTGNAWGRVYGYTRVPVGAAFDADETYYTFVAAGTTEATRFTVDSTVTADNWTTKRAAGLYTKDA